METQTFNSEPGTGPCGRCENCRCGKDEPGAAPPEFGAELRTDPATASPAVSITAMPAADGAESRVETVAGGAGR